MKYVMLVVQETADGQSPVASTAYGTEAEALSAYHAELAAAYASASLVGDAVFVLGSDGTVLCAQRVEGLAKPASDGAGA